MKKTIFGAFKMNEFEKSKWIKKKSAQEFVDNANYYILERRRMLKIMISIYKYFIKDKIKKRSVKLLDIGCGDGILTEQILKMDEDAEGTLIDGSSEMLKKAKSRLAPYSKINYIESSFQKLIKNDIKINYDFVVSSLAIHHLTMDDKKSLFQYIYNHLNLNGLFLNIDTVKAPFDDLEEFYLTLWNEWILEKGNKNEVFKKFHFIPNQYKNNPDNHPSTLKEQLNALKLIGFKNIDCYYKYGIFAIYGGQKM